MRAHTLDHILEIYPSTAKNSQSICRSCSKFIPKGDKRLTVLGLMKLWDKYVYKKAFYHKECGRKKLTTEISYLRTLLEKLNKS